MTEASPNVISGKLYEPDLIPPKGFTLHVERVRPMPQPGRAVVYPNADLGGALLTLSSTLASGHHVHGTAFLVAPGIAITAAHTIADWRASEHFGRPDHAIFAISIFEGAMRTWEVRNCVIPEHDGDVALLVLAPRFELASGLTIRHFELSAVAPPVGSSVFALGTRLEPAEAIVQHSWPVGSTALSIATISSLGPVREYFLQGTPLAPYPTFVADLFTVGGMSGGPVFDERGLVVGVISRSYDSETVETWLTFVALSWPALLFPFTGVWPPTMFPAGSTLQALTEEGARVALTSEGHLSYTGHIDGLTDREG